MTEYEDNGIEGGTQGERLILSLPDDLSLDVADSNANRRAIMILLRCLRRSDGTPFLTYDQLAAVLGYADRRNVHNYWMDFCASDQDLLAYLTRRKKVDADVVSVCEQLWYEHPLWSVRQMHAEVVARLGEEGMGLSEQNIRTAGGQVNFLKIQRRLKKQVQEGSAHYSEEALVSAMAEFVEAHKAPGAFPIPEALEQSAPGQEGALDPAALEGAVAELEATLFEGDRGAETLQRLWQGRLGQMLLAFVLYYHGISLSTLGSWFGVNKTTVMRWLSPFSRLDWQKVVQAGDQYFSGVMAIDEKWIKIEGVWYSLFAAVDQLSGMPLHVCVLPSNRGAFCQLFLLQLKQLGYRPRGIITDGWDAYEKAIAAVFPTTEHLLCRFHALKAAFRRLKAAGLDFNKRRRWGKKITDLFHTRDKRTVKRRLGRLAQSASGTPVEGVIRRLGAKLPKLLPAVGSTFRPSTANCAEQFFAAFDRFSRSKGPFQSKASAEKHIRLFLLGYVFQVRSKEALEAHQGRCLLQQAGYKVVHIPFFHLLNRPKLRLLQDCIAETFAPAA